MQNSRPTGITILAIIYLFLGILSLLWSMMIFGVGGITATVSSLLGTEAIGSSAAINGFLGMGAAVIQLVVGIGLLRLAKWSYYLALIAVGVTLVQGVVGLFSGGLATFVCSGLGLVVPLIIFVYLMSARVREVFGLN